MRIGYDPAMGERKRRECGYPLVLAGPLFSGGTWVGFADDGLLGYEHEVRRVASGAVEGRVLVRALAEHEDGEGRVRHVISWRDATRGETDAF